VNLGAEPKKIAILGLLLAGGGYLFYTNVISDSSDTSSSRPAGAVTTQNKAINGILNPEPPARGPVMRSSTRSKSSEEFHPSMKRKPEDAIDPMAIDPTLRLDLLAKVQGMATEGGGRNPFQFGQPPPPPAPPAPKIPLEKLLAAKNQAQKSAEPPKDPGPPKPPPLNLSWKYYGYTSPKGSLLKKAFFLDGEEILTANEGDVIKRKYRVVRIGVNSVVVEDTDTKSQQTLPLAEEAAA
jgi:hypothetical protein